MGIYLNWRTSDIGSKDRIIADLFSYLSVRWYPVNVIGSNIFDLFSMYATELASASAEVRQTYDDVFISGVRTVPVGSNVTSKIYDNFGVLLGVDKLFRQDYDLYSNIYSLQSYRQELRLLGDAFFSGLSVVGLDRVGQAYTGIAPVVIQPLKYYNGWVLTTYTGSVAAVGNNVLLLNESIPRIGSILPYSSNDPTFVSGDEYAISNSVLGYNTVIRDDSSYYAGLFVFIFGASASVYDSSFRSSIEQSMLKTVKGDQEISFYYSTSYSSYRPSTGSSSNTIVDGVFTLSSAGYLYNQNPTSREGSSFTGDAILCSVVNNPWNSSSSISGSGSSYNYYYDWTVMVRNDAAYTMGIRTYPSASIPSTVYFSDYNTNTIDFLPVAGYASGISDSAHWIADNDDTLWDISGFGHNLAFGTAGDGGPTLTNTVPTYMSGRSEDHLGLLNEGNEMWWIDTEISAMNFFTSFYGEIWAWGIDKIGATTAKYLMLKHDPAIDNSNLLNGNGYLFEIDVANQNLLFTIKNGSSQTFSASIASYLLEEPSRYHYFAFTYCSGSVYLYADDVALLSNSSASISPPDLTGIGINTYIFASGSGIGFDEISLAPGFLTPEMAKERFEATRPRILRTGGEVVDNSWYAQPKLTVYASGSNEFEFHQFNVKWLPNIFTEVFDKKTTDVFDVPIFLVTGSVI